MSSQKIRSLADLADDVRRQGGRVVHCHGVFDLLHIGHIRYLQKARALGERLVVTVTPDRFVNKGPHRPAFPERLRAEALAALDCVDAVAINEFPTAEETLRRLRPAVYCKGGEFRDRKTPELLREEAVAAEVGARVAFLDDLTSSSSYLINAHLAPFAPETERYLNDFRARRTPDDVLGFLEQVGGLRTRVVGEAIVDEIHACETLAQSPKAPIVAVRHQSHQRFAGGALAVANHIAGLGAMVELVALVGDAPGPDGSPGDEPWLCSQLRPNVSATFIARRGTPTIVKRRYRESYHGVTLFEVNVLDDRPLRDDERSALHAALDTTDGADLTVVTDYGHGMLGAETVARLAAWPGFLSVSAPLSAATAGYHAIGRHPRADFVALAVQELRMECRSRGDDFAAMLREVCAKLGARTAVVTLGSRGGLAVEAGGAAIEVPALATRVVDRVGAGDAAFAAMSLAARGGASLETIAFLGNVAGAEAVATVGSAGFLDRVAFARHVESLMK